jgi:RimJ/RimL family protein N-acetyltransferase
MVEILTKRLALTPLVAADAPALFAYSSNAAVSKYQAWEPSSLEDAYAYINEPLEFDVPGTWFQLGIRDRASDLLIGDLAVHFLTDDPHQSEIGFAVAPNHQGRGFATEAVIGLIGYLFATAKKHRVFASVDPTNAPSMALLRRVGMRQEAHFQQSLWWKGQWVDDVIFGVLASEWEDRRTTLTD